MSKKINKSKAKHYNGKSSKLKDGSDSFLKSGNPKDGCNDIVWWSENPQLLRDASNLSYGNVAGNNLTFAMMGKAGASSLVNIDKGVPGIMTLDFTPIIGVSKDGNSPVNNASRLVYAAVRHKNSGSRNYEQSDYFTYLLAVSNLLTAHAELVRLYGCAQVYHKTNRYVGKALINALGYNFDDVIQNLASLRYGINALAVRINSFAIPKSMHIFARHISLASYIFKDSSESKAQLYAFKPRQYFQWSSKDQNNNPGSSLKPVMAPTYNRTNVTVAEALAFVTSLIDVLAINEDCGIMSGDTLKCFEDGGIYHVNALPESYIVEPVYDQVMLSQIHNAERYDIGNANVTTDAVTMWVTQQDNNIIYNPIVKDPFSTKVYEGSSYDVPVVEQTNVLLDSGMEVPTPEFNMEATRLKASIVLDDTTQSYRFDSIGTEIINDVSIWYLQNGILNKLSGFTTFIWDASASINAFLLAFFKYQFDWAPIQYFSSYTPATHSVELTIIGETFNYTLIDYTYLNKVNNAALLSALNVYSLAMSK